MIILSVLLLFTAFDYSLADCTLTCAEKNTCFASSTDALDCMTAIPFNESWANATIDVVTASLENFGFGALYHNTGPPYAIQLDIQGELSSTLSLNFATDLDFQEHVQDIFQKTIDAHTRYHKPACYNAILVQPFAFDMRAPSDDVNALDNEPKLYAMSNIYTDEYAAVYPDDPNPEDLIGEEIVLLDGLEVTTAISSWGDTHETRSNNRGIRFNAAIRSYLYRSAMDVSILPVTPLVVTLASGVEFTMPWLAAYSARFGDVSYCESADPLPQINAPTSRQMSMVDQEPSHKLTHNQLHESRPDRVVIISPEDAEFEVSCFTQTVDSSDGVTADINQVLVMKVASFSPNASSYTNAWTGFLDDVQTCLTPAADMIVVDVMQNGGGYVCLGIRLIELLVQDYEDDHTLVQMNYDLPHSPLMDAYVEVMNPPDPYPDPDAVEQILDKVTQDSYPDGRSWYYPGRNVTQGGVVSWRSNMFSLDCREAEAMPADNWRPSRFMPPEKLIILTDGTCGSTCATFTKIPQEAGKATFVGAGGIWDEGMDVSSFAGGFVCNPGYLTNIANWSNLVFPQFLTNQRWQFGWAAWYSAKLPSRPTQFTVQDPDYRQAFWGFPHSSINANVTTEMVSGLYDNVISSSVGRVAASVVDVDDSCGDHLSESAIYSLITLCSVLGALMLVVLTWVWFKPKSKYEVIENGDTGLDKSLISNSHNTGTINSI